ncbi:SLAM family member 5 [Misgurnus anguillicaudatus]|uniref:SLAM family member 5 n=1 Tax=Misgurnus anguillicaudatus TaxID=75329 RepID=UPI003CCF152C
MAAHHLLPSFILFFISITGFSAEDTVFVETGASLELNIQRYKIPDEFDEMTWENEKSENVVKYFSGSKQVRLHSSYKDRVDFNTESFSLTLKNMKKTDSGVYKAIASGESKPLIGKRTVSVIDPVKTPELTVISYPSSDSCSVNFTCRAHDLTLHSTYNNGSCSPEEVTSHEKFTLILICSNETIICNHSNPISWETDRRDIKKLCEFHPENPEQQSWVMICILVTVVLVVVLVISVFCWKRYKVYNLNIVDANSVYAEVNTENQPMQTTRSDSDTCDVPDQTQKAMEQQPSSFYDTVKHPQVTA